MMAGLPVVNDKNEVRSLNKDAVWIKAVDEMDGERSSEAHVWVMDIVHYHQPLAYPPSTLQA